MLLITTAVLLTAKKGECDLAIEDFDKALELDSHLAKAYLNRGAVYFGKGNFNQGIRGLYQSNTTSILMMPIAYYNRGVDLLQVRQS